MAQALFQKALDAIGPREKIAAIHSVRWKAHVIQSAQSGARSFEGELVKIYPDSLYLGHQPPAGPLQKQVITPDFNYISSGTMTAEVPSASLEAFHEELPFDSIYIAQHAKDYTVSFEGEKQTGNDTANRLKIAKDGKYVIWEVDPQTGHVLSSRFPTASGDSLSELSDWRLIDGVYYVPFMRRVTVAGITTDYAITEYQINPAIDGKLFQRPTELGAVTTQGVRGGQSSDRKIIVCQEPLNCSHKLISGMMVKYIQDNGLVVVATIVDTGRNCKVDVAVINKTSMPVDVIPSSFSLRLTQPKEKELRLLPQEKIMTSIRNRAAWENFFTALGAAGATQQSTTQTNTNGSVSIYSSGDSAYGTYHGNSTSVTTVPDEQALQAASDRIAANNAAAENVIQGINSFSLRPTTIDPGKYATGSVFFERARKMQEIVLSIPVNGRAYQFSFGW